MRWMMGLVLALVAGPAMASGTTDCDAPEDPSVYVHLSTTRGGGDVLMILAADIETGDRRWSTRENAGEGISPILTAHAYLDARALIAEFTDPNVERIAVSLRLQRGSAEGSYAEAGVLLIDGLGAWAVTCIDG